MTSRMEVLDLVDQTLTERLGREKVTRRADGVIIVAGSGEAFAIQAMTIDAPDFANPVEFGEDLVEFIRSKSETSGEPRSWPPEGGRGIGKDK